MQWWSAYESPSVPDNSHLDLDGIKSKLLDIHGEWKSPFDELDTEKGGSGSIYQRIIELGCRPSSHTFIDSSNGIDSFPVAHPHFAALHLTHWSNATISGVPQEARGRIVLMGDAAHILPADAAQGASCAVEDAVAYAILLKHYTALENQSPLVFSEKSSSLSSPTDIPTPFALAAKAYEEVRKPRIKGIFDMMGQGVGDKRMEMGWIAEKLRDLAIRWLGTLFSLTFLRFTDVTRFLANKVPESMNDYLFAYDAEVAVADYLKKGSSPCGFW